MDELEEFWVHETIVRTHIGSGPFGEEYAEPVTVPCFIDLRRQLVRDPQGREVTSEATILGPSQHAGLFTPESLVAVAGDERTVITVAHRESGPLSFPDHFEITTT